LQLRLYLPPKNLARARCSQYFPAMVGFWTVGQCKSFASRNVLEFCLTSWGQCNRCVDWDLYPIVRSIAARAWTKSQKETTVCLFPSQVRNVVLASKYSVSCQRDYQVERREVLLHCTSSILTCFQNSGFTLLSTYCKCKLPFNQTWGHLGDRGSQATGNNGFWPHCMEAKSKVLSTTAWELETAIFNCGVVDDGGRTTNLLVSWQSIFQLIVNQQRRRHKLHSSMF
jgi:hypothetical protein